MSKRRVESCLTIAPPRGPLRDAEGKWRWRDSKCVMNYSIYTRYSQLWVYFVHHTPVHQEIPLVHTTPHYGGVRWWFLCPKCNQRVSRLHKPYETYGFFCRRCHALTYESVQSSGTKGEAFFQAMARSLGSTTHEARTWIRLNHSTASSVHEIKRPLVNNTRERRTGFGLNLTRQARSQGLTI
jgi:hypothetical protein